MCGIAGIIGHNIDPSSVSGMLHIIRHRGPDYQGFYNSKNASIGHARLSIVDLSPNGNQPFISKEPEVAVAVNGEIYNFMDIKKPLQEKGVRFLSESDCEVVLHAYIEAGLSFVEKLNGMFAAAIWDERKKKLFLLRDRLGIKPLYYTLIKDGSFLFASEIKALAVHPEVELSLDLQSFAEYLVFENYFGNRTLNEKIKMVEPGEIVEFDLSTSTIRREKYWSPSKEIYSRDIVSHFRASSSCTSSPYSRKNLSPLASRRGNFENLPEIYNSYLRISRMAVKRHLLSNVPVATYLSSGFDSSTVAYWASRLLEKPPLTYTGNFNLTGFYDEAADARRIAEYLGCPNISVQITPEDYRREIERIAWHLDEPRVGMGSFSQYMVARRAARDVKVILTGHGGDEFFAGYPVFKVIHGKKNFIRLLSRSSARELLFVAYFSLLPVFRKETSYFLPNIFPLSSLKKLLKKDFLENLEKNTDVFLYPESLKQQFRNDYERLTATYISFYLPSLFIVEDKISMAFSIESRTPLCDNELVRYALSIPLEIKLTGNELKHIPRHAMKGRLPEFMYSIPKKGFPTPLRLWFRKELKSFIREFILDGTAEIPFFDEKHVKNLVGSFQRTLIKTPADEIEAHKLWVIQNLIMYFRNQKARYSNFDSPPLLRTGSGN